MFTKRLLFILVFCIILCAIPTISFAQANPTIIYPATDNSSYYRGDMTIQWASVSGATYNISMRDLTVNMKVLNGVSVTSNSYTIPKKYFYEGHKYRIAVSAKVGTTVTWGERTFNINLSPARNTIISRGNTMNSYTWTPTKNVRGWKNNKTFYAHNTYTGIPYSQTSYQSSISSVSWTFGYYFDNMLISATSGFYDDYTRFEQIMPKYGSDCSGYVSTCWNILRHTTSDIAAHTRVGKTTESYLKQYARLSPGDALVKSGDHTFIITAIEPENDAYGNLKRLKFTCNEQTPYYSRKTVQYSDICSQRPYIGVLKDATLAQDYSWDWK